MPKLRIEIDLDDLYTEAQITALEDQEVRRIGSVLGQYLSEDNMLRAAIAVAVIKYQQDKGAFSDEEAKYYSGIAAEDPDFFLDKVV